MGLFDMFKKPAPAPAKKPPMRPLMRPGMLPPHPEPQADNNFIIVILDSCRYDSFMAAETKTIAKLSGGKVEKRYTYASWTAPSHYNLLTGLLPHTSPEHVYASEYYKEDFFNYNTRLGAKGIEFAKMVPGLWFPELLRNQLGYKTNARVSLPVLNPKTGINRAFDSFQLMDSHNDMASMLPTLTFDSDRPSFYLLNVGETHYPYATAEEPPSEWPRLPGVHGLFGRLAGGQALAEVEAPDFFSAAHLRALRERQVRAAGVVDRALEHLFDRCPRGAHIIVTSDHGELFGEGGLFGHGPIHHEKVLEVPFIEGVLR